MFTPTYPVSLYLGVVPTLPLWVTHPVAPWLCHVIPLHHTYIKAELLCFHVSAHEWQSLVCSAAPLVPSCPTFQAKEGSIGPTWRWNSQTHQPHWMIPTFVTLVWYAHVRVPLFT